MRISLQIRLASQHNCFKFWIRRAPAVGTAPDSSSKPKPLRDSAYIQALGAQDMISRSDAVESIFGYWPDFADAEVSLFAYESTGTILLDLSYIDAQLDKGVVVSLRFTGVSDVALTELTSQNVLDGLNVSMGNPIRIELEACYGLSGSFACTGAEVAGVAPNNSFKQKPLRGSTQFRR